MHRQQPLDLLLSQSAGGLGYIPRVAGELGIPCVAIMHCSMLGELRTRWWDASSARGIYRLVRHIKRLPRMLLLWHKAAPMVDRWIIVSHETAHDVQRELALAPERVVVIRNGIDTTRFKPDPEARKTTRMRMHIPDEAPLFICSGRLEYEKGFQVAIHAIRTLREQFPHVRLLIAGSGFYQQTLQNMAADMQETVLLPGYIPNEEIPALLAAADFFLMPTLRDEGLPMNILEALASGLPVIASRAGGIPSAIEDGHTGILVPRGDSDALAQAAAQLWHNPAQRTAMRTAAREAALKHFSHNHMVDATEQILMKTQKGTR
jgi:glycosyltransferase involved in cell wall biosynthesis